MTALTENVLLQTASHWREAHKKTFRADCRYVDDMIWAVPPG